MRLPTLTCGVLLIGAMLAASTPKTVSEPSASASFQGPFQTVFQNKSPHIFGEPLYSVTLTQQFYENRAYTLVWSKNSSVTEDGLELLNAIEKADKEGLLPAEYHLWPIKKMVGEIQTDNHRRAKIAPLKLFYLDILMTDAFFTYGSHLLYGRIRPVDEDWIINGRSAHLPGLLEDASNKGHVRAMLKSLLPTQSYYSRLRIALDRYRNFERTGGWEAIDKGPLVKPGMNDDRIPALRKRLAAEGDFKMAVTSGTVLDDALVRALSSFQSRHGLDADGALGQTTLTALNVPVERRIRQIILNMERCRWLPWDMGDPHIVVNVANFSLDVVQDNETVLNMKVVVGKPYRRTPVFSSTMSYVVLNPTWSVPKKIAALDILEHIREQPDYLKKMGFTVYRAGDDSGKSIDPDSVDWSKYTLENLDYRFVQAAGPMNALGRIKFIFPNDFDVYLHDTPSRELFNRTVRDFSSGCIRLEKPLELAVFVMQSSDWTREALDAALATKQEKVVPLKVPIRVHLLYWTVWGDAHGRVQFRDDIYGRDEPLEQALREALKSDQG